MMRVSRPGVAAVFITIALVDGIVVHGQRGSGGATLRNPVPPSPESVAAGKQLYVRHCASCHGASGTGGPGSDLIPPAPSLVGDHWDHGSTDGEIFTSIKDGIGPDFNMVPWKDLLKDDDIWNIVNYVRSIARKP
jgi:mono/diheme cytochrome c family protein